MITSARWAAGQGRAQPMCRERKTHWGSSVASTHRRRPCPTFIGGEESCKTSSSAGPWCWPRPRHRGQRIPTVPSRIGPVEVDFVLVRHFLGRILFRPSSTSLALRATRNRGNITIPRGVVFFSDRFYNRKGVPFWLAQRPK